MANLVWYCYPILDDGTIIASAECRHPGRECERNLVSPAGMVETPRLQAKRRAW